MNPEELYKQIKQQESETANCYESEISSREYINKYFDSRNFSVKKYLRLANKEKKQRKSSRNLY